MPSHSSESYGETSDVLNNLRAYLDRYIGAGHVALDIRYFADASPIAVDPAGYSASVCRSDEPRLVVRVSPGVVCLFAARVPDGDVDAPCPKCFDLRCLTLLTLEEQWAWQTSIQPQRSRPPYLIPVVIEQIGLLAKALLVQVESRPTSPVYVFDPLTQQIDAYELLPDSFCTCSAPHQYPSIQRREFQLRDTLVAKHGKSRMLALGDFSLPDRALINPICGANGNEAVRGYQESVTAPVFGRYMQRYDGAKPRKVTWSGLSLCLADSRVAGMMEAFERQAGQQPPPSRLIPVKAPYRSVAAEAIDPRLSFAYNSDAYERPFGLAHFDENMPIEWVWGYSLVKKRPVLVPRQLAFYTPHIEGSEPKLLDNSSNGCATGSCYEEAILKGLLELVERDAFMITWYQKLSHPRLDLSGFPDRKIALVMARMEYLNYDIKLLDARLDISCPAVIAIARRRDKEIGAVSVGAAANPDPAEAIHAALFEAATAIVELPKLVLEQEGHLRMLLADYERIRTVSDHQFLYGFPEMAETMRWMDASPAVKPWSEAYRSSDRRFAPGDIGANLQHLVQELVDCGMHEVAVVDQTTREERLLGVKTVVVIVPGLAPLEFGHPRNRVEHLPRLYSAPAKAGFVLNDTCGLNSLPHPFP